MEGVMTQNSEYLGLEYAFYLFDAMVRDNLGYIYRGEFNDDIADNILSLTEVSLQAQEESSKIKKRVYAIMVEGLQNITRHQDEGSALSSDYKSMFVLQKVQDKYYITTGNLIENNNIDIVKDLITKINSLDKDELKQYYKQVLKEGTLSDKGGAGLGLIDMARKSGNKLSYLFKPLQDNLSYFYLHTMPTLSGGDVDIVDGKTESLNNIVEIHKILNTEDVFMIFNGMFNEDSLSNIMCSLQKNVSNSKEHEKIFTTLLKNIVEHGANPSGEAFGNPGVFYINEEKNKRYITTGNYIPTEKEAQIVAYIKKVNELDKDALQKSNSGLANIKKQTNTSIQYAISNVDSQFKFLSIRAALD